MNTREFRAELVKIMPGYKWTVKRPQTIFMSGEVVRPPLSALVATGSQSSGSNRLSTLQVERVDRDGVVSYVARSAGYGLRAKWLHANTDGTLARALRGLQDYHERMAATYQSHADYLRRARASVMLEGTAS